MKEESWRRNPGRGTLDGSWKRNPGGEKSWKRDPGGGPLEEESWGGETLEEESWRNPRRGMYLMRILEEEFWN